MTPNARRLLVPELAGPDAPRSAIPAEASRALAIWRPYVEAATWLALTAGFGLGAMMAVGTLLGVPSVVAWTRLAPAHGHAQVFGWLTLMVLGVGFHFLPRLSGAALVGGRFASLVLALVAGGVVSRLIAAVLVIGTDAGAVKPLGAALLIGGAVAELLGALLALAMLGSTLSRGSALTDRAGPRATLPFFVVGFLALPAALGVNLVGAVTATGQGVFIMPGWSSQLTYRLALDLFVVSICVGMSARTFPLFLRTPLPRPGVLHVGLTLLVVGLALRTIADLSSAPTLARVGLAMHGLALLAFAGGLGILGPPRPLPRDPTPYPVDPVRLHGQAAYLWLALDGVLLLLAAAADRWGLTGLPMRPDLERHLVGAGFATLLVFGVGAQLLPAFGGRRGYDRRFVWATLLLGNVAVLARIGPLLSPWVLPSTAVLALFVCAGICGVGAIVAFRANALPPSGVARLSSAI